METYSNRCTIFEIEDGDEANESNDLHYIPLTDFDIPHAYSESMAGMAANGLLLLYWQIPHAEIPLYICNPLTRQYIELYCPEEYISKAFMSRFGFGLSKISGQYKVVCINGDAGSDSHHVYTLGTRTWRCVEAGATSGFRFYFGGCTVCNGNLHWTVYDPIQHSIRICGFDVETECFSIFSTPVIVGRAELSVLRDCLCYCYTYHNEIVIWLMKKYQVEESWTIEYKLSTIDLDWNTMPLISPIKAFKDDGVLMLLDNKWLIYYSNKTRTTQHVGMFKDAVPKKYSISAMILTPSFFSLKSFRLENVISF